MNARHERTCSHHGLHSVQHLLHLAVGSPENLEYASHCLLIYRQADLREKNPPGVAGCNVARAPSRAPKKISGPVEHSQMMNAPAWVHS